MKSALLICLVVSLFPSVASVFAAEPRTAGIETAASGPLTDRRIRSREEMESAQTDGLGYSRGKRNGNDDWFEPMRFFEETDPARPRASAATARERSTPEPTSASGSSDGIVTGSGQEGSPAQQSDRGNSGKGMVNAAGGASGNEGRGPNNSGKGKGIVNGWGGSSLHSGRGGDDAPRGKGIVNAAGGAFGHHGGGGGDAHAGKASAPTRPAGAGIVTGAGTAAVSAVTNGSRGIVSAAGGPIGHHGKGEGRGGGKH